MARLRGFGKVQGPEDEEEKERGQASYKTFDSPPPELEPEADKEAASEPEIERVSGITAMPETSAQETEAEILAVQETVAEESVAEDIIQNTAPIVVGSIEKIIKSEKDLSSKYSDAVSAADSILTDGEYYEDYMRASNADLLKSKEFVLAALAQNPDRFYAPETPKPAEWLDEEYLTARTAYFFARTKECIKPEENAELAENLYNYLLKAAFSSESYAAVTETFKRVAKVNAARISSDAEGERMKESLYRFNEAATSAVSLAKQKYEAAAAVEAHRQEELKNQKSCLAAQIDAMDFKF